MSNKARKPLPVNPTDLPTARKFIGTYKAPAHLTGAVAPEPEPEQVESPWKKPKGNRLTVPPEALTPTGELILLPDDRIGGDKFSLEEVERALIMCDGYTSIAARVLKCHPDTVRSYVRRYPKLKRLVTELDEAFVDLAENCLRVRMTELLDMDAIKFALKCKGKHRGWVERGEVKETTRNINIKIVPAEAPARPARTPKQLQAIDAEYREVKSEPRPDATDTGASATAPTEEQGGQAQRVH
jgi:hypothetical protein